MDPKETNDTGEPIWGADGLLTQAGWEGLALVNEETVSQMVACMPTTAENEGQRRLKRLHGSPRFFAQKCIHLKGDASWEEVKKHIMQYALQWYNT